MIFGRRRYSSLRSMLRPLTIFITQFMLLSVGMPPRSAATSIIEGDREGALLWERYEMYVREFNKTFASTLDKEAAFSHFGRTDAYLRAFSSPSSSSTPPSAPSFTVGHSHFSDWSPEEIQAHFSASSVSWARAFEFPGQSQARNQGRGGLRVQEEDSTAAWRERDGAFVRDEREPVPAHTALDAFPAGLDPPGTLSGPNTRPHPGGTGTSSVPGNDPLSFLRLFPPFSHLLPPPRPPPALPTHLDWSLPSLNPTGRSVVSPPVNQGRCGGCWSLVSASVVESAVAISTRSPVTPLSAQELLDCDVAWNAGCLGGNPIQSYAWVKKHGLAPAQVYPYRGEEQACEARRQEAVSAITGYRVLPACDEAGLLEAVARQPVAVGIAGQHPSFLFYAGGIYDDEACGRREGGATVLNHALVVVGYGRDAKTGVPYWKCKNSWGQAWGEDGFVRIRRWETGPGAVGKGGAREGEGVLCGATGAGVCGLALAPSIPLGAYGGNATAWLQAQRMMEGKKDGVIGGQEPKKGEEGKGKRGTGRKGASGADTDDDPIASLLSTEARRVAVGLVALLILLLGFYYFMRQPVWDPSTAGTGGAWGEGMRRQAALGGKPTDGNAVGASRYGSV